MTTHCWPARPPPRSSLDRRQRDVHDGRVEQRDERAHDRGEQAQALAGVGGDLRRGDATPRPARTATLRAAVRRRAPPGSPRGGARHRVPHAAPAGDRAARAARRPPADPVPGVPRPAAASRSPSIPGIPRLDLGPDVVFLVFLPPLLYAAAFNASPRDLRAQAGRIALLAVALVVLTVLAVARSLARLVLGELSWPMAFVLGAVLAPTDPVAATAVFRRTPVPERVAVVVTGESLVNDGVGLTIYRAAVGAATAGRVLARRRRRSTSSLVAAGGIAIGLAVGWVLNALKRRVQETEIEITLSLFTPYAAYIAAEHAGVSGVLAAVAVGVYSGWRSSEVLLPETRVKVQAFWTALAFLLESMLFVLVGLQLPVVLDALAPRSLGGLPAARAGRRRRGDGGADGVRARRSP